MNKSSGLIGLALAALALVAGPPLAQAGPTQIASISGAYDLCYYDTPCLVFHNTTAFDFTNVQMVLKGYGTGTLNNGITQTVTLSDMAANGDTKVIWNGSTIPKNLFAYDYDDEWGYQGPCPFSGAIDAGLCAQVGNFSVTFTAMWNGQPIYSVFSPTTNASGGFVGWEGIDPAGWSENPLYDVHAGSLSGVLAYIYEGTPPTGVPEPGTFGMVGLGMLMLGLFAGLRRRVA